jgi:hypothetical protein
VLLCQSARRGHRSLARKHGKDRLSNTLQQQAGKEGRVRVLVAHVFTELRQRCELTRCAMRCTLKQRRLERVCVPGQCKRVVNNLLTRPFASDFVKLHDIESKDRDVCLW